MLYSSIAGITDGLCLFELSNLKISATITLPLKELISAVCDVIIGLRNPREPPVSLPTAVPYADTQLCSDMQTQEHRLYVDDCAHVCNIFVSLPASTVILAPHTVSGSEGSKRQYLCCHDNSEATPCFLHPTPQHAPFITERWKEGLVQPYYEVGNELWNISSTTAASLLF